MILRDSRPKCNGCRGERPVALHLPRFNLAAGLIAFMVTKREGFLTAVFPLQRAIGHVFANANQFCVVADDVFVIVALP